MASVTLLLFLVVEVGIVSIGVGAAAGYYEKISLEDIRKNPENYLDIESNGTNLDATSTFYATFTIVNITLRPDMLNRFWKTYYLVYINDTFGYELPFVISEDDLSEYQKYIGETVLFKLYFYIGHELVPPEHFLVTNILAVKADISSGLYFYVTIYLAEPAHLEDIVKYPENYILPGNNLTRHNEFYANFTLVSVSEPVAVTDWYGKEWKICIVVIKDSYGYGLPFYISSKDYQNYTLWVNESVPFNISISDGPCHDSWSLGLTINRIACKPYDNYHSVYSVYIQLAAPLKKTVFSSLWWAPLAIGTMAVTTLALTALAFLRLKGRVKMLRQR